MIVRADELKNVPTQRRFYDFFSNILNNLRLFLQYILQPLVHLKLKFDNPSSKLKVKGNAKRSAKKDYLSPFSDIPGPKGWPVIGDVLQFNKCGGPAGFIQYAEKLHNEYGDIFKVKLGPKYHVFVSNPRYYRDVIRQEGAFPHSFKQPIDFLFEEVTKIPRGLFFQDGEKWLHNRSLLTNLLLKETGFLENIFESYEICMVSTLKKWAADCDSNSKNVNFELDCYVHFLKVICHLTFGSEYEKYIKQAGSDIETLAKISIEINELGEQLYKFPPKLARAFWSKTWKRFEEIKKLNLTIGRKCTEQALAAMKSSNHNTSLTEFGLLHRMKNIVNASDEEIIVHCVDFTFDIPVTSLQLLWALYALGRNPDVQERVYEEVTAVSGEVTSFRDLEKLPLVQSTQKEIQRMYPVSPFVARFAEQDNMFVGGYEVDKGTVIVLSTIISQNDSSYFPKPEKFWPDRWCKTDEDNRKGVFDEEAYHPWGIGKRGCAGRHIATNVIQLFIASVVKNFTIESDEVRKCLKTVLYPDGDMNIRLKKRNNNSLQK